MGRLNDRTAEDLRSRYRSPFFSTHVHFGRFPWCFVTVLHCLAIPFQLQSVDKDRKPTANDRYVGDAASIRHKGWNLVQTPPWMAESAGQAKAESGTVRAIGRGSPGGLGMALLQWLSGCWCRPKRQVRISRTLPLRACRPVHCTFRCIALGAFGAALPACPTRGLCRAAGGLWRAGGGVGGVLPASTSSVGFAGPLEAPDVMN